MFGRWIPGPPLRICHIRVVEFILRRPLELWQVERRRKLGIRIHQIDSESTQGGDGIVPAARTAVGTHKRVSRILRAQITNALADIPAGFDGNRNSEVNHPLRVKEKTFLHVSHFPVETGRAIYDEVVYVLGIHRFAAGQYGLDIRNNIPVIIKSNRGRNGGSSGIERAHRKIHLLKMSFFGSAHMSAGTGIRAAHLRFPDGPPIIVLKLRSPRGAVLVGSIPGKGD